jgi:membrane-bound lytic murein transglycosylase D
MINQKRPVSLLFVLIVSFLVGCAHKGTYVDSEGRPQSAREVEEENKIKELPKAAASGDLEAETAEILRIDVEINPEVEKWIEYFQGRGRPHFERYLERSGRYIGLMKKILKDNGVSEDLIYIAMIESGFSGKIKSKAKAVGYWQFIGGTGKHYGLRSNNLVDERYDPVKSTEAAAKYFKGLYNLFGSWFLAIASYNVGENRIKSLVMKNYTRDFWELARRKQLPAETRHYIPKYLAARMIAMEPEKYGFSSINYHQPLVFDLVTTKEPIDLKLLAKAMRIEYDELKDLNPAYKTSLVPVYDEATAVRVPQGTLEAAKLAINEAVVKNKKALAQAAATKTRSYVKYKVRRGDTLSKIAQQFDTSIDDILKLNRLNKNRLRPGMTIKVPSGGEVKADDSAKKTAKKSLVRQQRVPANSVYVVKRGDTLIGIARKLNVKLEDLVKENELEIDFKVQRGQKIHIPQTAKKNSKIKKVAEL